MKMPSKRAIVPPKSKFDPALTYLTEFTEDGAVQIFPLSFDDSNVPFDKYTEFHVDHLKSVFSDVARPNLFKIKIVPPTVLEADWSTEKHGLMALAKSTRIPSMTVKDYVYERAGQKLFIPTGEIEYGDASITFINDSDFSLRTMFTRWIRLGLHNWKINKGAIPQLALQGKVIIYHYDRELNPTYAIELVNAWPSMLSEIELSHESENVAEEFTVTFKYSFQEHYKNYGELV